MGATERPEHVVRQIELNCSVSGYEDVKPALSMAIAPVSISLSSNR